VDFPIENGGSFHNFLYVYQRVPVPQLEKLAPGILPAWWHAMPHSSPFGDEGEPMAGWIWLDRSGDIDIFHKQWRIRM
jgi:hypothetical protein